MEHLAEIKALEPVLTAIIEAGGTPVIVGGFVRDHLLNRPSKDVDVEVFGLEAYPLRGVLHRFGQVKAVGKAFGVFKLNYRDMGEVDFTLPRRERKVADGHKGFKIVADPHMTFEEASFRRDFTVNAMGWDVRTKTLIDPHGGQRDLESRILRAVSERFAEDPLRVLRGMRFAAQCELHRFDPETITMCRDLKLEFSALPIERIWEEWYGWARKAVKPSLGMEFLRKTGWIEFFPEVHALIGVPQDPTWHPEGDVYVHTLHCLDAMRVILDREGLKGERRAKLMFTILGHDFAKPETTVFSQKKQRWTSPMHCPLGAPPMKAFLERINAPERYAPFCMPLVKEHLVYINPPNAKNVMKLANRLGDSATIEDLLWVIEADQSGRPPLPQFVLPANAVKIREIAGQERVQTSRPKALIQGSHLIEYGLEPGPSFGPIIKRLFQAQLNQKFNTVDEGLALLPKILKELEGK